MRWVVCGWLAAVTATACVARLPHPGYTRQPTEALEPVAYPPPPARVEFVPAQPAKGAAWIDGEWAWQGRRWAWRMGRWVIPPPDAAFAPWTVVRGADGTIYYAQGAWRDGKGREVAEPVALATARTNLADVVDPEGNLERSGRSLRPETRCAPGPSCQAPEPGADAGAQAPAASDGGAPEPAGETPETPGDAGADRPPEAARDGGAPEAAP